MPVMPRSPVRREQAEWVTDPVTHLLAKLYPLGIATQAAQARRYRRYAALFMVHSLFPGAIASWMLALPPDQG
jgi:hypothetical protein